MPCKVTKLEVGLFKRANDPVFSVDKQWHCFSSCAFLQSDIIQYALVLPPAPLHSPQYDMVPFYIAYLWGKLIAEGFYAFLVTFTAMLKRDFFRRDPPIMSIVAHNTALSVVISLGMYSCPD